MPVSKLGFVDRLFLGDKYFNSCPMGFKYLSNQQPSQGTGLDLRDIELYITRRARGSVRGGGTVRPTLPYALTCQASQNTFVDAQDCQLWHNNNVIAFNPVHQQTCGG